jgi:hypothetical protein
MKLEDLVNYAFPVAIRVSYPCDPGECCFLVGTICFDDGATVRCSAAPSRTDAFEPDAKRTRREERVISAPGEAEGVAPDVAPQTEVRAVVELQGVACMLMRESDFFLGALSNGFRETATKVINYHADSQQGELRVAAWMLFG